MKKTKLFLSICTLCLCFAVLCMGVYAAQSVSYTISGTISYTVEDVFATISAKVFKVSGQQDTDAMQTNVATLSTKTFDQIKAITTPTYTEDTSNTIEDFDTTSAVSASRTVAITMDNTYMTYYIVINISNSANVAINAKLTDGTTYTNLNTANKLIQNNIAKGETKNLIVAFSLADKTVGISSLAINYSIEVGYTEYSEPTFLDTLTTDTANSYWYVELGTLSDGTAIRWRIVSLDGETRYKYSSTKPAIGTGTVFVQETYLGSTVAFDADASKNYYESDIKTTINTLTTWNIAEKYISSLIAKRNIQSITYGNDPSTAYEGTTSDYFWLLSGQKADTYLTSTTRKWTSSDGTSAVAWWLRSPCNDIYGEGYVYVTYIDSVGSFEYDGACDSAGVRAAFQLA